MSNIDIKSLREKLGITQEELAKKIGVHARTIQNWEAGTVIPASKHAMLRALIIKPQTTYGGTQEQEVRVTIPLIPISAQGGSLNDFTSAVTAHDCEKVISPIMGADYAVTVTGDSMWPEYPSGCQVIVKRINERAFIDWGRVYVLDTINGIVIKKIMPTDSPDVIKCVSINPDYPSFEVEMEHIFGMYRVLMCMSMK